MARFAVIGGIERFVMIQSIEMRVRVVNLSAGGWNWSCRASVPAGSVVEEFREFVLGWRIGIENEDAVGVERDFPDLPGIGGFR